MRHITSGLVLITLSLFAIEAFADHSPKKMMRNVKAYAQLSVTGKLGPFDVNYDKFGEIPNASKTSVEKEKI